MIRVLYAEDDPQITEMVQLYFERFGEGCVLELVDSGRRCLDKMQQGGVDVLMLDLVLPDLDGLQILGELTARRDPTPVIMVSGHGQHELAVRALRAGAVDCIDKNSPEFLRLPDIVRRAHERRPRRQPSSLVSPRIHRILFVDPQVDERTAVEQFFTAKASRLQLTGVTPAMLEATMQDQPPFDGFVLGPHLEIAAMLDTVRQLRSRTEDTPVVVVSTHNDGETAIAAFRLGAHDYLLHRGSWLTELVFTLNNVLKRTDTERLNAQLAGELAELNRSLADQVAARTRDLEAEIAVRRAAENQAEDHAARLQALSTKLLRVQEDERRAIAQELHDQVGQLLTGLRFQLEAAGARTPQSPLAEALTTTDELLRSIRALTLQLRPRMLDDLGLQPALEWHTNLFGRQTGITVELEISLPGPRLPTEMETTIYRMVQEALTNVARHSGSKVAFVTVTADERALQVEIADRGRGFDSIAAIARRDSLGLTGLAERVRLAGGQLEIVSQNGHGTRVHAEFPLVLPVSSSSS